MDNPDFPYAREGRPDNNKRLSSPGLTKMLDIDLLAYLFSKKEFEMVKALCALEQCLIQGQ